MKIDEGQHDVRSEVGRHVRGVVGFALVSFLLSLGVYERDADISHTDHLVRIVSIAKEQRVKREEQLQMGAPLSWLYIVPRVGHPIDSVNDRDAIQRSFSIEFYVAVDCLGFAVVGSIQLGVLLYVVRIQLQKRNIRFLPRAGRGRLAVIGFLALGVGAMLVIQGKKDFSNPWLLCLPTLFLVVFTFVSVWQVNQFGYAFSTVFITVFPLWWGLFLGDYLSKPYKISNSFEILCFITTLSIVYLIPLLIVVAVRGRKARIEDSGT